MVLFIFAGALIRQYFVLMHAGIKKPAYPAAGVVLLLIVGYLAAPASLKGEVASAPEAASGAETISVARVQEIMDARCVQCHAAKPNADFGFTAAPAGMLLDTIDNTVLHAEQVKTVVHSKYMPLGNMTQMTDEERAAIAAWSGTRD
jgi:uncharacterized membrane protein